ncbi:hypothetical protein [Pseudotamlana agarivorans]|uniref:hypothetical protein n=1 Tax=Pseudotamlana agarivorans TaxID=481183 RepID=UPI000830D57D|nr:hypothetical protein [Tamlana agarivorans]
MGRSFLNALSDLYNPKYKKVHNYRGLFEHVKEICGSWEAFKSRAVQFTFPNDRGDLVTIDGDIPEIKSACHPKTDKTLFSAEYFHHKKSIPSYYLDSQDKEVIDLWLEGADGGFLVIPPYVANRRFNFEDVHEESNLFHTKSSDEELIHGKEWGAYKKVALRWAIAMNAFRVAEENYEKQSNHKFDHETVGEVLIGTHAFIEENNQKIREYSNLIKIYQDKPIEVSLLKLFKNNLDYPIKLPSYLHLKQGISSEDKKSCLYYNLAYVTYQNMLLQYAPLQTADLYAHFSPVAMITHKKILTDFPDDDLGKTSIFDRIKKAGEDRFYRVEYVGNGKEIEELTDEEKREQEKKFIERTKTKNKLINSSISDTEYINNVKLAYVNKKKDYESKLYDEEQYKN